MKIMQDGEGLDYKMEKDNICLVCGKVFETDEFMGIAEPKHMCKVCNVNTINISEDECDKCFREDW